MIKQPLLSESQTSAYKELCASVSSLRMVEAINPIEANSTPAKGALPERWVNKRFMDTGEAS